MKTATKIVTLAVVLTSSVTAASAQIRNGNPGVMAEPFYGEGPAYIDQPALENQNNYGVNRPYIWATPQDDGYNPGGN